MPSGLEARGHARGADQVLAGRGVPEPGRPIIARRGQEVVRWVEGDEDDRPVVALQDGPRPVRGGVPEMDLMVIAAGGQRGTVPAPGQPVDPPARVRQLRHDGPGVDVPDFDHAIDRDGDRQEPAERVEGEPQQVRDPLQPPHLPQGAQVVDAQDMIRATDRQPEAIRAEGQPGPRPVRRDVQDQLPRGNDQTRWRWGRPVGGGEWVAARNRPSGPKVRSAGPPGSGAGRRRISASSATRRTLILPSLSLRA